MHHYENEQHLPGQSVTRTGHKVKELRHGEDKVEHLWDKEEKHGFAEVTQNGHHCKRHPREVAKGVTHKHTGRIPASQACQLSSIPNAHQLLFS